jgi:predicted nucleic acid-binding protein
MVVVDANVIAALVLEQDHSDEARRVWERDPDWCAPALWASELRSIVDKCVRAGLLPKSRAVATMTLTRRVLLPDRTFESDDEEVLALASKSGCSTYDCEYVAVARRLNVSLLTLDKQVLKAFPDVALLPLDYLRS